MEDDNRKCSSIIATAISHKQNELFDKTKKQGVLQTSLKRSLSEATTDNYSSDNNNYNSTSSATFSDNMTIFDSEKIYRATTTPTKCANTTTSSAKRILSHPTYHDFANTTDFELLGEKTGTKEIFPVVLYQILEKQNEFYDIIRWNDHGRSFVITIKDLFANNILPLYFHGQKQYSSFHRQLNSYGFLRITKIGSVDRHSFYHERFLRGRPQLAYHLPRTRQIPNTVRVSLDKNSEPDFAQYPPVAAETDSAKLNDMHYFDKRAVSQPTQEDIMIGKVNETNTSMTLRLSTTHEEGISSIDQLLQSRLNQQFVPLSFSEVIEQLLLSSNVERCILNVVYNN